MLSLSSTQAALIALVCGAWLAVSLWATLRGLARARAADVQSEAAGAGQMLVEASPALSLIVEADGRLEGAPRLPAMLGLKQLPDRLDGLEGEIWEPLRRETKRAAATAARFALSLRPPGAARVLHVQGGPAPAGWRDGAALLWFVDMTDS